MRFSASVDEVKHNYHTDDGRGAEKGRPVHFPEDAGPDTLHVHNHKLHRLG